MDLPRHKMQQNAFVSTLFQSVIKVLILHKQ